MEIDWEKVSEHEKWIDIVAKLNSICNFKRKGSRSYFGLYDYLEDNKEDILALVKSPEFQTKIEVGLGSMITRLKRCEELNKKIEEEKKEKNILKQKEAERVSKLTREERTLELNTKTLKELKRLYPRFPSKFNKSELIHAIIQKEQSREV